VTRTKRERTRERLIEAAAEVIGERGWLRASLEQIAARAGMTRGAIYGNFKNREALFLAVVQARWKPVIPPLAPGDTFRQYMEKLGPAVASAAAARRPQAAAALSFQLYALTNHELRSQVSKVNAELYRRGAERLREVFPPEELPLPPDQLVRVLHGLTDGLTFLSFLTPELITSEVLSAAFLALAGGAAGQKKTGRE